MGGVRLGVCRVRVREGMGRLGGLGGVRGQGEGGWQSEE